MDTLQTTARRYVDAGIERAFSASAWRVHWREVEATDWSISFRSSGRYHRGIDHFSTAQAWPVLYTSLAPEVAVWEMVRRSAARKIEYLKNNVLSEIAVELEWVLELTPSGSSGADTALLTGPRIELCQEIAAQARDLQFQGLLVPSAALDGTNLVVIPDNLSESSMLRVVQTTEMQIDF